MSRTRIWAGAALLGCAVAACSSNESTPSGPSATSSMGGGGQAGSGTDASSGGGGPGGAGGAAGSNASEAGPSDAMLCGQMVCPFLASCRDGACACPDYKPDTCGTACVDVQMNPEHCGNCTTRCAPGAACNAGSCGATPSTVVASAPGCDTLQLALSGGTLYWTDKGHGTVMKVATGGDGAAPSSVATGQKSPRSILLSGGAAYWINGGDNTVMKVSLGDAGAPTALVTLGSDAGDDVIGAILVVDTTLYYAVVDKIYRVPAAGGASTLVGITQQQGVVGSMAFDTGNLYYPTKLHNDVEIMATTLVADGGSQTSRVADSQGSLFYDTILISGGRVYWGNGGVLYSGAIGSGPNRAIVTNTAAIGAVTGFAIGSTHAYLGESGEASATLGYLEKAPLAADAGNANGTAVVIARDQSAPNSVVLDATKVYWSTRDVAADAGTARGCTIMSLPQ